MDRPALATGCPNPLRGACSCSLAVGRPPRPPCKLLCLSSKRREARGAPNGAASARLWEAGDPEGTICKCALHKNIRYCPWTDRARRACGPDHFQNPASESVVSPQAQSPACNLGMTSLPAAYEVQHVQSDALQNIRRTSMLACARQKLQNRRQTPIVRPAAALCESSRTLQALSKSLPETKWQLPASQAD
ncbi:hypothetical protein K491DRAFT_503241 [Lophiostoma macrostomum CBS 122681]|uniref:Uncharacterized protein n=1 Tax=Lophiostoma macrostomum CBS 122681 TaxID=1314788 RepID=A0A6A6T1H7_9PLEO|nr:hypothetical protein K491DRAFT_503241 [Lophiostoma macrostomum CBS 122681]